MWHTRRMTTAPVAYPYTCHRSPAEIISHCVWFYFCFCLIYREVEELMLARGLIMTYEAIRKWCRKFEQPLLISSVPVAHSSTAPYDPSARYSTRSSQHLR
jgi:hypothetical protein